MPADAAVATAPTAPVAAAVVSSPAVAPAAAVPASPAAAAPAATPVAASPAAPAAAVDPKAPAAPVKVIDSLIGDKPAEGDKPAQPAPDAPQVYDLKLPEGVEVDAPMMDSAKAIFAEGNVTPEVANKLVGLYGTQIQAAAKAMAENQITVWNDTIKAEQGKVMADPEIGGDKFPAIKAQIERGLETMYGINERTPADAPQRAKHQELMAALKYTGAGSFLPVLRFLAMATKPHSEGGPVQGNVPTAPKRTLAERLYPTKEAAE